MNNFKKVISCIISFMLMITALPAQAVVIPNPVDYKYEFSNLGKITSADFYDNSDTIVINIQDLHSHKTVQDNIFKFLTQLNNKNSNIDIYLEGASNDIDYSDFIKNTGKENTDILFESMYNNDQISGTEYFSYKNSKVIKPIENSKLYETNIKNYSVLIKNKNDINNLLMPIFGKLLKLKKNLAHNQKKLLTLYNLYLNKKISAAKFYTELFKNLEERGINPLLYTNSKLFLDISKEHASIDKRLVEVQLQTLLAKLKDTISFKEYTEFLKTSNNLTNIDVILSYIKKIVPYEEQALKYPELFRFINIRELSSIINPIDLLSEEYNIVENILLSESKTTENKDIIFLNLFFQIYRKLLNANISSEEYQYYLLYREKFYDTYKKYYSINDFDELYKYTSVAEDFNKLNIQRNNIFIKNILSQNIRRNSGKQNIFGKYLNTNAIINSLNTAKNIKIVVSGGFHTEGINELLNKNKISNITITPNITKSDPLYEKNYYDSIVLQAETSVNTINKMPFYDQNSAVALNNDIAFAISGFLKSGKSLNDISDIIYDILQEKLKAKSDAENIDINYEQTETENIIYITTDNETIFITVDKTNNSVRFEVTTRNNNSYYITYKNGKVSVSEESPTALGQNIKTLVKEALRSGLAGIESILGNNDEYIIRAKKLLMSSDIMLPGFLSTFMTALFDSSTFDHSEDMPGANAYKIFTDVLEKRGGEFKGAEIQVSDSSALTGIVPDGYGNIEQYGSLFFVIWKKGIPQKILISNELFVTLENTAKNNKEIEDFFYALILHERLENLAIHGKSKVFDDYITEQNKNKENDFHFTYNSESFHRFIQSSYFSKFLKEQKIAQNNKIIESFQEKQIKLLTTMEQIINETTKELTEYSNIVSLYSHTAKDPDYKNDGIPPRFMQMRLGDTTDYTMELTNKIAETIKEAYIAYKTEQNPNFDFDKLDIDDFADFINNYTLTFLKNDEVMFKDIASFIAETLCKTTPGSINLEKIKKAINVLIIDYSDEQTLKVCLKNSENLIEDKKVFFITDIISKKSTTFNRIYKELTYLNAETVRGCTFFDLSNESQNSTSLTKATYEYIKRHPDYFTQQIISLNGQISKYAVIWFTELLKNSPETFQEIVTKIENYDTKNNTSIKKELLKHLIFFVENNIHIRDIKKFQIFELVLKIALGTDIDPANIQESQIEELKKETAEYLYNRKDNFEENYSDWQDFPHLLIIFATMHNAQSIDVMGINNIPEQEKKTIETYCNRFKISLTDTKKKLKQTHEVIEINAGLQGKIDAIKATLDEAKTKFTNEIERIFKELPDPQTRFDLLKDANAAYCEAIKNSMLQVRNLVIEDLKTTKNIHLDQNLFTIIIGGSLVKGNIIKDSDIYYKIIVPDGIISKSVDRHFAPLYSNILEQIGLTNYYILPYSSSNISRDNINTVIDEKEVVSFLDYEVLSEDKGNAYAQYLQNLFLNIKNKGNLDDIKYSLAHMLQKYLKIATEGSGWIGDSFHVAFNENEIYSTRWTLKLFETKIKSIIFDFISKDPAIIKEIENNTFVFPTSMEQQINFINDHNLISDEKLKTQLMTAYESWKFLSAYRYTDKNNRWTIKIHAEDEARQNIVDFAGINSDTINKTVSEHENKLKKQNPSVWLLRVVEELFYDEFKYKEQYTTAYSKYYHLEEWQKTIKSTEGNDKIWNKAKIISLLIDIDSPELRKRLTEVCERRKDEITQELDFNLTDLFESIDRIKFIDNNFPGYKQLEGERTLQNYWDAVAKKAGNPETLFALMAHKLTNAQSEQNNENKLLIYSVYLPLSKRFGNPKIYEYVRNALFEYDHPSEYLNLLKIIEVLYGEKYSEIDKKIPEAIKENIYKFLKSKGLNEEIINATEIKSRVKSLYSIYEKLNSERKKEGSGKNRKFSYQDRQLILFALNSNNDLFYNLIEPITAANPQAVQELQNYLLKIKNDSEDVKLSETNADIADDIIDCLKKSVFSNQKVIEYVSKAENKNSDFTKWFQSFFANELKDFAGLHIVISDKYHNTVINTLFGEDRENPSFDGFTEFAKKAKEKRKAKSSITFTTFKKDKKNKQARLKINATTNINKGSILDIPIELCFYKESDYNAETYGIYNEKLISAPHFIYKLGANFLIPLFQNIFKKVLNFNFISNDSDSVDPKKMVFYADNFVPSENLADNFSKIINSDQIASHVICFVEYKGKIYVQSMPKDSIVFDLISKRHISNDLKVAAYGKNKEKIPAGFYLEDSTTYKIFDTESKIFLPLKTDTVKTIRGNIFLKRANKKNETNPIVLLNKNIKNPEKLSELLLYLVDNNWEEINNYIQNYDGTKLNELIYAMEQKSPEIAELLSQTFAKNGEATLISMLKMCISIMNENNLNNLDLASFILRTTGIALHYDLSNMFELFEATYAYSIINFKELLPYYKIFPFIKSKFEEEISDSENKDSKKIIDASSKLFASLSEYLKQYPGSKIKKITRLENRPWQSSLSSAQEPATYNLRINDDLYFVEYDEEELPTTADFIHELFNLIKKLKLNVEYYPNSENGNINKDRNTFYLTTGFGYAETPLPLMSLGSNVEQLVKHAVQYHSDMVKHILVNTGIINSEVEHILETGPAQALEESPALTAQVLIALFTQDSYDEKTTLSAETPLLTVSEISNIKDLIATGLNTDITNINISVSRTLDVVEDTDTFSLSTLVVLPSGEVTLYISEAFLKALETKTDAEKQEILKQLAMHETEEYIATTKDGLTYEQYHNQVRDEQKMLFDFAQSVAVNVSAQRNALQETMSFLLDNDSTESLNSGTNAIILCGSRSVESFEKAFELYRQGKIKKIFITGNTRGTDIIMDKLRNLPENQKYREGIQRTSNSLIRISTVEEYLALTDTALEELKSSGIVDVELTEADIIKWVLIKNAQFAGMSKREIKKLEASIILEKQASNTPENFENVMKMPEFKKFINSSNKNINIVIVQTPFSQRRAHSTFNRVLKDMIQSGEIPGNIKINSLRIDAERSGENYHLDTVKGLTMTMNELTRLIAYTLKGDIIPLINSQSGISAIPAEILKDILMIVPLLNDTEKQNLKKVFTGIEQFKTKEAVLEVLKQHCAKNSSTYMLIADFINYLYSDTTDKQQKLSPAKSEQEKPILPVIIPIQSETEAKAQMEKIRSLLAAA